MCLIIVKPKGLKLNLEITKRGLKTNNQGLGIIHPSETEGLWTWTKFTNADSDILEEFKDEERLLILHMRKVSVGIECMDNVHPFEPDPNWFLVHNGTLKITPSSKEDSDSKFFAEAFLGPISDKLPLLLKDKNWCSILESLIGLHNKMVLCDIEGNYTILNEKQGTWKDGLWYSNEASFVEHKPMTYRYSSTNPICPYCGQRMTYVEFSYNLGRIFSCPICFHKVGVSWDGYETPIIGSNKSTPAL